MPLCGVTPNLVLLYPPTDRVCIRDVKEAFSVHPRFPERFQYMVLDVEDNEEQNLIRLFPGYVVLDSVSLILRVLTCVLYYTPDSIRRPDRIYRM